eukprot:GHVT01014050.1.p1 GENE.GHVT01014050.1~~GHVT01014050.1.p1  ORF type:complete len:231 (-),score=60.67 GHVT01014050.1:1297-1989(-)
MPETITAANITFKFVRDSVNEQRAEHQAAVAELNKLVEDVRAEQGAMLDSHDEDIERLCAQHDKKIRSLEWEVEDWFAKEETKLDEFEDRCEAQETKLDGVKHRYKKLKKKELDSLKREVEELGALQDEKLDSLKDKVDEMLDQDDASSLRSEIENADDSLLQKVENLFRKQTSRLDKQQRGVETLREKLREIKANRAPPATQAHAGGEQPPPPPKQPRRKNRVQKNPPT